MLCIVCGSRPINYQENLENGEDRLIYLSGPNMPKIEGLE